jgi:3-deoxy-D-manno-octulosonic-acid transferase
LLLSARLSLRSARGYAYLGAFTRELLGNLTHIAAQSQTDAQRFLALGANPKNITVTGNLKFDAQLPPDLPEKTRLLREKWGNRPIWIAASTHEGEEIQLLNAHIRLLQQFPTLLLILVPRHPERFNRVAQYCQQANLSYIRRSEPSSCHGGVSVYLADTMGELPLLYRIADVAVVAGSFIPHGGHNPLEPALARNAIISGSSVFNFADIYRELQEAQAAILVENNDELVHNVILFLTNAALRQQYAERAYAYVIAKQGALTQTLTLIDSVQART